MLKRGKGERPRSRSPLTRNNCLLKSFEYGFGGNLIGVRVDYRFLSSTCVRSTLGYCMKFQKKNVLKADEVPN